MSFIAIFNRVMMLENERFLTCKVHYASKVNILLFSEFFFSTEALFFLSSLYINHVLLALSTHDVVI